MNTLIDKTYNEVIKDDTSYLDDGSIPSIIKSLFKLDKYSKTEMRETWYKGIKFGIEIGINNSSIDGQIINIHNNMKNKRHEEFYDKFLKLAHEYNCQIIYHPQNGMVVLDMDYKETNNE